MNKGQLVDAVASELSIPKAAASRAIDSIITNITNGIKTDEAVTIAGFGSFTRKERPARNGRNPSTGEPMLIKASTTVNFKPSQALKETV